MLFSLYGQQVKNVNFKDQRINDKHFDYFGFE